MPGDAPLDRDRLPALDGVRGLAILLVLANNFTDFAPRDHVEGAVLRLAKSGWVGVDLFFVLSGFLITGILLDGRGAPRVLAHFWARRALRIVPAYALFLAAWWLLAPRLGVFAPGELATLRASLPWYAAWLANVRLALVPAVSPAEPAVFWSLAVEEQFYLAWPLVVLGAPRRLLPGACVALAATAVALRIALRAAVADPRVPVAVYALTPTRMDALLAGALLALAVRDAGARERLSRVRGRVAAGALLVLAAVVALRRGLAAEDAVVQAVAYPAIAVAAAMLVAFAVDGDPRGPLHRALGGRALGLAGRVSYGTYVWHAGLHAVADRLGWYRHPAPLAGSPVPRALLHALLLTLLSLLLGALSWWLVERRVLRLRRRFPTAPPLAPPAAAPPAAPAPR